MSVKSVAMAPAVDGPELGIGERAALSLALEVGRDSLVLLDDAAARVAAKQLGLATTGTIGVLLLAKERGLVNVVGPELAQLEQHGFRMTEAVRRRALQLAGE
jgi:predicted nucleic acid-binding protein